MAIELASLEIPIEVTGSAQAQGELRAVEATGVQAAAGLTAAQQRVVSAAGLMANMVGRVFRSLLRGLIVSGILLTLGLIAKAIQKITSTSKESTEATERMTAAITRQNQAAHDAKQAMDDLNAQDREFRSKNFWGNLFSDASTVVAPGLSGLLTAVGAYFTGKAAAIATVVQGYRQAAADAAQDQSFKDFADAFERDFARQKDLIEALRRQQAAALTARKQAAAALHEQAMAFRGLDEKLVGGGASQAALEDTFTRQGKAAYAFAQAAEALARALAKIPGAAEDVKTAFGVLNPEFEAVQERAKALGQSLNTIVLSAIQNMAAGIGAALAGEGGIGSALLGALGQAFQQFGAAIIAGSAIIQGALTALASLQPWAAVALGAALVALGAFLSAKASQAFGGGGVAVSQSIGGAGFEDTTTTRTVTPSGATPGGGGATARASALRAAQPVQNFFTIIGPNDPTVQRQIALAVAGGTRRGL